MSNLTATRLRTIALTRDCEVGDIFAAATIAAAANGKGSTNDLRRYARRAEILSRSLPEHLAHVRAEDVRSARKFKGL